MALTSLALLWLLARLIGALGWLIGGVAAGVFLVGILFIARKKVSTWWILGLAIMVFAIGYIVLQRLPTPAISEAGSSKLNGEAFSEEKLSTYRAEGRPVFLYFTADWCVTCKVNEAAAIDRDETAEAFARAGIVTLVGDHTRRDPAITRFLAKNGRSGVPLYLYYPKGGEAQILPQVLTVDMLTELAQ